MDGIWVSGQHLYFIDENNRKMYYQGSSLGKMEDAVPGSIWVEGDFLMFIDANKYKRRIPASNVSNISGLIGSLWLNNYFYFISENSRGRLSRENSTYNPYSNVAHSDRAGYNNHRDYPAFYDAHDDYYSGGSHVDNPDLSLPHIDNDNSTPHSDRPHSDRYTYYDHTDFPRTGNG